MTTLSDFIQEWTAQYRSKLQKIELFQTRFGKKMNLDQKKLFVRYFYHIRGHFYPLLWFLGSFAPNRDYKKSILENIQEEFGARYSHEQMYFSFANFHGVDLKTEIWKEEYNVNFIKKFNQDLLQYTVGNQYEIAWAAFCTYEKLDSLDYSSLRQLAVEMGTSEDSLIFFTIHMNATHFESVSGYLQKIWETDQASVILAFEFIAKNQLDMWNNLSDHLNKYRTLP